MNTSYFGNLRNVVNPLSISGKAPDWYTGPQFKVLAPKWSFFSEYKQGLINADGYTERYFDLVLLPLNPAEVYENLTKTYGENVTLLCYERPGEFCHRRLVANWFNIHLGVEIPEL